MELIICALCMKPLSEEQIKWNDNDMAVCQDCYDMEKTPG